jgi:hypothetical protein
VCAIFVPLVVVVPVADVVVVVVLTTAAGLAGITLYLFISLCFFVSEFVSFVVSFFVLIIIFVYTGSLFAGIYIFLNFQ